MAIELYSPSKPAYRRRALGCTLALLALTSWLALDMTARRAGNPLGSRVEPPGWRISFRVPRHFLRGNSTDRSVIPYFDPRQERARPVLALWEVDARSVAGAAGICDRILFEHGASAGAGSWTRQAPAEPRPMGSRQGMEAADPGGHALVRAVRLDDGIGYAVSLLVTQGGIDQELYHLYDLTCESIEYGAP